jgi:hypothetical protein
VFHDPARAPFRVMPREQFERRWNAADRWMAVVVPRHSARDGSPAARVESPPPPATTCERLVSDGVRLAQAGDLDGAEKALGAALSCPGPAALRELAGVRLLQRRWPDVAELAAAAVAEDPADEHGWRLLATSRFLQDDREQALEAWNRVGELRVDLISVAGLTRTRPRVVEELMDVPTGSVLTNERLRLAARRLAAVPALTGSRIEYVPVPSGLAEIRAAVVERPLLPTGWPSYGALALTASVRRAITIPIGAPFGGGERIDAGWRFWPNRPLVEAAMIAPAPWGGLWSVAASWERQPFDAPLPPAERRSFTIGASNWLSSRIHARVEGGADAWSGGGPRSRVGTALQFGGSGDRVSVTARVTAWPGGGPFAVAQAGVAVQSSSVPKGTLSRAHGGMAVTSTDTPLDLWFGGDTGHASPILLRAHPLLDGEGALKVERLSRRLLHASGEVERWWTAPRAIALAAAVFVDAARLDRRVSLAPRGDVDVGVGVRLALPGLRGSFRVDLARGLRDGATAVSVAYRSEAR